MPSSLATRLFGQLRPLEDLAEHELARVEDERLVVRHGQHLGEVRLRAADVDVSVAVVAEDPEPAVEVEVDRRRLQVLWVVWLDHDLAGLDGGADVAVGKDAHRAESSHALPARVPFRAWTTVAPLLHRTAELANDFLDRLPTRPVGPPVDARRSCARPSAGRCRRNRRPPCRSSRTWRAPPSRGSSGTAGPRYFGFVVGGSVSAGLAADWLTSAWDQNTGLYVLSPAAAVAEEVAAAWLIELFGLPRGSERRVHHGRDDGELHRARGGAPRASSSARAGTSRTTAMSARHRSPSS